MSGSGAVVRPRLAMRVMRLFSPYRGRLVVLGLVTVTLALLGIGNPLLTKAVFDRALFPPHGGTQLDLLLLIGSVMVALTLLSAVLAIVEAYLTSAIGQRVSHDLRENLFEHLHDMSLRFFTATRTGDVQSRLVNDVGSVGSVLTENGGKLAQDVAIVLATIGAMLFLSWQLTILSLLIVPCFLYIARRVGRARRELSLETQQTLAELSVIAGETLSVSGILLAKIFDRRRTGVERYRLHSRRLADLKVRQQMVGRTAIGIAQVFVSIAPVLVYVIAGFARSHGTPISPGTVVAFTVLQARLFFPFQDAIRMWSEVQSTMAMFERVFEYLDLEHDIVDSPRAVALAAEDVKGRIELRGASFHYEAPASKNGDEPRHWALDDVSLAVEPGQLAAIVGPSGAGKTTLSYLVPRLYDVQRGSVRIDGVDVRELRLSSLAEVVGMVTQETYLFHASVRENLTYARPDATQEQIDAAARAAHIHERIAELDEGYDTVVGERGYRMSGGEKQRLAIARVILKDPRILILDEATSALDTTSERLVQTALEPLMAGRTTIAIAHRLSTILAADVIFVLDRGRLVERGTHAELVRLGGLYATLYEQQFEGGFLETRCNDGVVLASGRVLTSAAAG